MDYPKSVPGVGLVDGKFVDEDQVSGTPGSLIPAAWGNAVTQELLNVLARSGIEPAEAQVDQLAKAIFDSPTFGAAAKAATAAKFDSDQSIATTAFVREAGMQANGVRAIEAATTLTAADVGKMIVCQAAGGFTVTLPLAAALPIGTRIEVFCATANVTIARAGGEALHVTYAASGAVASLSLGVGDRLTLIANSAAGGWFVEGSAQLYASSQFATVQYSTAARSNLPGGWKVQRGSVSVATFPHTLVFPEAFPNECTALVVTGWNAAYGHNSRAKGGATIVYQAGTAGAGGYDWLAIGR